MAKNETVTEYVEDGQLVSEITGSWEAVTKDNEGNAHIHTLHKHSVKTRPILEEADIEQILTRQAAPTKITPSRAKPVQRDHRVIASLPDAQIGYRNIDGELVPIHDERAIKVARFLLKDIRPDVIVNQGDTLDLGELSKYPPDSTHFVGTLQASIDRAHTFYAELRADHPEAEIHEIDSNHVARLTNFVLQNVIQVAGIRRANLPESMPVMSYSNLLRLDELGVQFHSGYPAAEYAYSDDLLFIHGKEVRSNGSTADLYSKRYPDTNVVFGHIHRHEVQTRTTRAGRYLTAITFGTLARTDGAVPSYGNAISDRGEVVRHQENWQQGIGVITDYDGDYVFEHIPILDGKAYYRGKQYGE